MAGSYNKIIIIGNVGRDPEKRFMSSGDAVTSFSVATSERFRTRDGQQQERTTWFNVSAFGKLADTCEAYLHKGSYVYVEGALSQREYTAQDGTTRTSLDVRAREMRMLDRRGEDGDLGSDSGDFGSPARPSSSGPAEPDADMDSIPF